MFLSPVPQGFIVLRALHVSPSNMPEPNGCLTIKLLQSYDYILFMACLAAQKNCSRSSESITGPEEELQRRNTVALMIDNQSAQADVSDFIRGGQLY